MKHNNKFRSLSKSSNGNRNFKEQPINDKYKEIERKLNNISRITSLKLLEPIENKQENLEKEFNSDINQEKVKNNFKDHKVHKQLKKKELLIDLRVHKYKCLNNKTRSLNKVDINNKEKQILISLVKQEKMKINSNRIINRMS